MNKQPNQPKTKESGCADCPIRKKAEENPNTFMARLWRWHTSWCPGWKAYQASLVEQQNR